MSSKINYIILHLSAFALLPFSAIAQNDSITNDGISQRKKPYFSFDIGTGVSYRATENADKYNDIPSLWNYPNGTCVPRKAKFMLSFGKFKTGLGFAFQKDIIRKYYNGLLTSEEIEERQELYLTFGYYPFTVKNISLGLQAEYGVVFWGGDFYYLEPVIEINLNNHAALYTSIGIAGVPRWHSKFTLYGNVGIRLNAISNRYKTNPDTLIKSNIAAAIGLSFGGAYNFRHFSEPFSINDSLYGYNNLLTLLPSPSRYTFIEFSFLTRNLNDFTAGFGTTAAKYRTPPDLHSSYNWLKILNIYGQYDRGIIFKRYGRNPKKNFYPYFGSKVEICFEDFGYYYKTSAGYPSSYGEYNKTSKILLFQIIAGARANFSNVFIDAGFGCSVISFLWGKWSYCRVTYNYPIEYSSQNNKYFQKAKPFFSDMYVKIGYKF
jgi:hypothetical protein